MSANSLSKLVFPPLLESPLITDTLESGWMKNFLLLLQFISQPQNNMIYFQKIEKKT